MDKLTPLEGYRFVIPEGWPLQVLRDDDAVPLQIASTLLGDALAEIQKQEATLETLSLYHLWSRASFILRDIASLRDSHAMLATTLLDRATMELQLHLSLISLPLGPDPGARNARFAQLRSNAGPANVRRRLRGYAAWLLYNEERAVLEVLRPQVLRSMFDAKRGRDLARELEGLAQVAPTTYSYFDAPETLSDAEAEAERKAYVKRREEEVKRLERIRRHGSLLEWNAALTEDPTQTLAALLDGGPNAPESIRKAWRSVGRPVTLYDRASSAMHGSALTPFLLLQDDDDIVPGRRLRTSQESQLAHLGVMIRSAAFHLGWITTVVVG